jgi:uncharacterized protein YjbJ (UPF0337 family)
MSMATMNVQQLQGSWNKLRGQVKEKWGNLTDDDLTIRDGNMDQVIGKIQQKTGESREAIEDFLNKLTSKGASAVSQVAEVAGQYAQQAGEYAQHAGQQIRDTVRDQYQNVAEQANYGYERAQGVVRSNPTQSVAVAFGIGLGLGVMVGLAMRSR